MTYWLWWGFVICIVLGSLQWGYTHPNSPLTIEAKKLFAELQAEVESHF